MILSTFRSVAAYQGYYAILLLLSNSAFLAIMNARMTVELVQGALFPDAAMTGYTPQQALDWYEAIGQEGRNAYVLVSLIDLTMIIPAYVLMLSCYLVACNDCPEILCYLPLATACFDLMESLTHCLATLFYPTMMPSSLVLLIASGATQFKCIFLGLSLLLASYYFCKAKFQKKVTSCPTPVVVESERKDQ